MKVNKLLDPSVGTSVPATNEYNRNREGVVRTDRGPKSKAYDKAVLDEMATKLQSQFRGFKTRKETSPSSNKKTGKNAAAGKLEKKGTLFPAAHF